MGRSIRRKQLWKRGQAGVCTLMSICQQDHVFVFRKRKDQVRRLVGSFSSLAQEIIDDLDVVCEDRFKGID